MTRLERLSQQESKALEKLTITKTALAKRQAAIRFEVQKARNKHRFQVGTMADHAGLLTYDLGVLEKAFAWLAEALATEQYAGETLRPWETLAVGMATHN